MECVDYANIYEMSVGLLSVCLIVAIAIIPVDQEALISFEHSDPIDPR
jgi:hypothetical protein